MSYDVVVVGLGAAGAAAAGRLARAGRRVLALEAQGYVGGRVRTAPVPAGVVELGAEWIHGSEGSRVHALAAAAGVPLRAQSMSVQAARSDGAGLERALLQELVDYCLAAMEDGSDRLETLGDVIERKFRAYIAERHPQLAQDEDFVDNFLEVVSLLVNNHEASDDWRDVTALSGYRTLAGEQHLSWGGAGYRTLFQLLLNTYNGGEGLPSLEVQLNKEVTNIRWSADDVTVRCADGAQYSAPHAVVTVSLGVLKERHATLFTPALPPEKVEAINNISIGVMDKIIMTFDEEWWDKDATFFLFIWRNEDRRTLAKEDRWVTRVFGVSSPLGARNTLTFWTSGEVAKMVETLPEELVRSRLVALLQRFMGRARAVPPPTGMLRSTWYSNPFTRGSYSYDNAESPRRPGLRAALAAPLPAPAAPRLLFAGEATDGAHFSTVHGAAHSGLREAARLLPASNL